jgi:ketosteroid isomerase-like protein
LKTLFRLVLAAALAAFGVWLWLVLFPSPQKVIARQFEKLARAASIEPNQGFLPRLTGAQEAGSFFAATVQIDIDTPVRQQHEPMSRDDIVQAFLAARVAGGLKVRFPDISVTVGPDRQTAQADVTVEARTSDGQASLVQAMRFTLQKIDGKWLITRVQTVRTLS